jgi:hypothetical protein
MPEQFQGIGDIADHFSSTAVLPNYNLGRSYQRQFLRLVRKFAKI